MTVVVEADGFRFRFANAIAGFKFDDYHNEPMKSVDVMAEFPDSWLFVEIKEYDDINDFNVRLPGTDEEVAKRRAHFRWLKGYLKYKYRDTYIFRSAEQFVNKPIHYICLINFDRPMNNYLAKELRRDLPCGLAGGKWPRPIVASCQVLNEVQWNANFPAWSLERI